MSYASVSEMFLISSPEQMFGGENHPAMELPLDAIQALKLLTNVMALIYNLSFIATTVKGGWYMKAVYDFHSCSAPIIA